MSDRSDDPSEVENAAQAALIRKLVNALLVVRGALTAAIEAGMVERAEDERTLVETRDLSRGLVYPRSPTTGNGDEP